MRAGRVVALALTAIVPAVVFTAPAAWSAPLAANLQRTFPRGEFQRVSDDCWWWGVRWQFGWRGIWLVSLLDTVKPLAPAVVAPEAVPPGAVAANACVQWRRDGAGRWHTHRVC